MKIIYHTDIWKLTLDIKKNIDNDEVICCYESFKSYNIKWKCKNSKICYQISSIDFIISKRNIPEFLAKDFPVATKLVSWIKENSKAIDTINSLKAFL
jgi:hypothetical protein